MDAFVELVHEQYMDVCFSKGRVPRARLSALEGFLRTYHPEYVRNRLEAVKRQAMPLLDFIISVMAKHATPDVVAAVKKECDHAVKLYESSAGASFK